MKYNYIHYFFLSCSFALYGACCAAEVADASWLAEWHMVTLKNPAEPESEQQSTTPATLAAVVVTVVAEPPLNPHYCQLNRDYFQHRKSADNRTHNKPVNKRAAIVAKLGLIESTGIVQRPPAVPPAQPATQNPPQKNLPAHLPPVLFSALPSDNPTVVTIGPPATQNMPDVNHADGIRRRMVAWRKRKQAEAAQSTEKPKPVITRNHTDPNCRIS